MAIATISIKLGEEYEKLSDTKIVIYKPTVVISRHDAMQSLLSGDSYSSKQYYSVEHPDSVVIEPSALKISSNLTLAKFVDVDDYSKFCDNNEDMTLVVFGTLAYGISKSQLTFSGTISNFTNTDIR